MAEFFPLLQQLSRKRARQDTEQLQLWAAKRRRTESQMFLSELNERRDGRSTGLCSMWCFVEFE